MGTHKFRWLDFAKDNLCIFTKNKFAKCSYKWSLLIAEYIAPKKLEHDTNLSSKPWHTFWRRNVGKVYLPFSYHVIMKYKSYVAVDVEDGNKWLFPWLGHSKMRVSKLRKWLDLAKREVIFYQVLWIQKLNVILNISSRSCLVVSTSLTHVLHTS